MSNTVTIKFRAKRDHFAGGMGYKVPSLKDRHVSVAKRDTLGILFMQGIAHGQDHITKARFERYAGLKLPGVVWENGQDDFGLQTNHEGWTITPVGKGFMADVTITLPLERKA